MKTPTKTKVETLEWSSPDRFGARWREPITIRGSQIQIVKSVASHFSYTDVPIDDAIKTLMVAAEGLEDAVINIEIEPDKYEDGSHLVMNIKGFKEPNDEEKKKIQMAREFTNKRNEEQKQFTEAREKAELKRLQEKYLKK